MIKAMIFDLDGTLLDSMHVWDQIGVDILHEYGKKAEENLDKRFKDMSIEESLCYIQETYLPKVSIKAIQQTMQTIIYKRYQYNCPLKVGVYDYLNYLYQKGIKLYVLTASDKTCTLAALKQNQIIDFFDMVMTCEEIGYGKRESQLFSLVLQKINHNSNDVIVVEDALHAIKAAKQVGLRTWAVYEEVQQADWQEIIHISEKHFQTIREMEEYDVQSSQYCRN